MTQRTKLIASAIYAAARLGLLVGTVLLINHGATRSLYNENMRMVLMLIGIIGNIGVLHLTTTRAERLSMLRGKPAQPNLNDAGWLEALPLAMAMTGFLLNVGLFIVAGYALGLVSDMPVIGQRLGPIWFYSFLIAIGPSVICGYHIGRMWTERIRRSRDGLHSG